MRTTVLASSLFLAASLLATAQPPAKPTAKFTPKPAPRPAPARTEAASPAQLPVTRVSLYKNGVGFFEHAGRVSGDQSVTIDFTTAQLNDVLQSLTAVDLNGGRIAGADYNSTTPLDQQLKALPFSLGEGVTFSSLFTKLRGARVQVTGPGANFSGRIVDIEMHKTGAGKTEDGMTEGRFLTLAGDSGEVRIFEITPAVTVRLLDTTNAVNLTQFLKVLDANRDQGLRHLTLQDIGPEANKNAARELHVSYLSEVPIWKSTYRILFTDPQAGSSAPAAAPSGVQTATLQGWSVVDNTTGADWINVHLSLIAGAPQSFIQPLSVPYYSRRPEIGLPEEAQLSPQTHESGEDEAKATAAVSGQQYQIDGLMGGQLQSTKARATGGVMGGVMGGLGSGIGAGSGGNFGGGVRRVVPDANATAMAFTDDSLNSLSSVNGQLYQQLASASVAPNSSTSAFDDYFAYNLTDPVTIRKNESALVPILQTKVDAERVTLWSAQQPAPLRALWITNTSNLTLDRGSFAIVEDGNFGGEGLLDPIHPNEKRLLSYAVDQAVRVTTSDRSPDSHITEFIIADGWLRQISSDSRSVEYTVHNAASEARTVIIEHPLTNGWTLDPTSAKPEETTSTVNRYRAVAQPGGTAKVHIDETRLHDQNWHLMETDDAQFNIILHNAQPSPQLLAQIQPILDARHVVAGIDKDIHDKQTAMDNLIQDQDRLRSDLGALKDTPEQRTLATRYTTEMNNQEDQLATLRKDMDTLNAKREAAQQDLNQKIAAAKIDVKL